MKAETLTTTCTAYSDESIEVTLNSQTAVEIAKERTRGNNASGLLFGQVSAAGSRTCVTVDMYLPLTYTPGEPLTDAVDEVREITEAWSESPSYPKPVGVFASPKASSQKPFAEELPGLSERLHAVLLVVMIPTEDHNSADVYIPRENGSWPRNRINWPAPSPERQTPRLASLQKTTPTETASPVTGFEANRAPVARLSKRTPLLAWVVRALAAALVISAGGWVYIKGWPVARNTPPTATAAVSQVKPSVDLNVARNGSDLQIQWNHDSELIRNARQGLLYIDDGEHRTRVFLEQSELITGRILYAPRSSDVDIRFELLTSDDKVIRESVRMIQPEVDPEGGRQAVAREPRSTQLLMRSAAPPEVDTPLEENVNTQAPRQFVPPATKSSSIPAGATRFETLPAPEVKPNASSVDIARILPQVLPHVPLPPPSGRTNAPSVPEVIVPATPVRQVPLSLPNSIRQSIMRDVTIPVTISIDEAGNVLHVDTQAQPNPMSSYLASLAKDTARRWKFKPAMRAGKPIRSEFTVVYRFGSSQRGQ